MHHFHRVVPVGRFGFLELPVGGGEVVVLVEQLAVGGELEGVREVGERLLGPALGGSERLVERGVEFLDQLFDLAGVAFLHVGDHGGEQRITERVLDGFAAGHQFAPHVVHDGPQRGARR